MSHPQISFEFFPPKSLPGSFRLWDCAQALAVFGPRFVSVTYGAGGSTRRLTHEAVRALQGSGDFDVAAHLTCVDASREETLAVACDYADAGVSTLVALRGDAPKGEEFSVHPEGFSDSISLIRGLADLGRFDIIVGAYPECHPEAASQAQNIDWLKRKIDAGATGAITQFFFEAETFLRFRDACAAAGITAPITPGILPIADFDAAAKFADACGADVPQVLRDGFAFAKESGTTDLFATVQATELCSDLLDEGVDSLHFYTLNRPELTRDICIALGFPQRNVLRQVA